MGRIIRNKMEPAPQDGERKRKEGRRQRPLERQYSEETKARHERVITRLLSEFDLEETKEKYRTSLKQDVTVAGNGSNGRLRRQLIRLMGSDVIRMTDKKWNDKFMTRLEEDYKKQQEQRETDLADLELQRLRRLRLEGVLPLNDSEPEATTPRRRRHSPRRKRKRSPRKSKSGRSDSQSPQRDTDRTRYCSSPPPHHPPITREIRTQMEVMEGEQGGGSYRRSPSPRSSRCQTPRSSRCHTPRHRHPSPRKGDASDDDVQSQSARLELETEEGSERYPDETFSARSSSSWVSRRAPPEICRLYEQESVNDLYTFAEKLVH